MHTKIRLFPKKIIYFALYFVLRRRKRCRLFHHRVTQSFTEYGIFFGLCVKDKTLCDSVILCGALMKMKSNNKKIK